MKKKRQGKIIEIIEKYKVGTQEELSERLRDGAQRYIVLEQNGGELENKYVRVLQEAYSSVDTAQNLVVIRTVSGMAMAVAAALDAMKLPEIVGCIAGDDTIFVAVHTQEETRLLREKVRMIVTREVHDEQ